VLYDRQRPDADGRVGPSLRPRRAARHQVSAVQLSAVRAHPARRVLLRALAVATSRPVRSAAVVSGQGRGPVDGRQEKGGPRPERQLRFQNETGDVLQYCGPVEGRCGENGFPSGRGR